MMYRQGKARDFGYKELTDLDSIMLEIPCQWGEVAMYVIMPKDIEGNLFFVYYLNSLHSLYFNKFILNMTLLSRHTLSKIVLPSHDAAKKMV